MVAPVSIVPAEGNSVVDEQDTIKMAINSINRVFIVVFRENVVYNAFMRILFLSLVLFSSSVFAQSDRSSFFDYLRNLGNTECQAFLNNGNALVTASNKAADSKDWDNAFYYDEEAFHTFLKAWGHCDEEPENKEKAMIRLDEIQLHGRELSCMYHLSEASSAYQRSTLALEHIGSVSIALKHAKQSVWSLSDAEKYCAFDDSRIEHITKLRTVVTETVRILEEHVTEHGEDGIVVP